MWRLVYVVGRNLYRLPGIIGHMRKLIAKEPYSEKENYAYLKWITNEILRTGHIRVEGHGMEHLPQEGGYLMCPNHQGKLDAYAIVAMHDNTCTVVMDEAKSYTIFIREIIDMMRGKRLELNNPRKAVGVIKAITEEVAAGRRYILFPARSAVSILRTFPHRDASRSKKGLRRFAISRFSTTTSTERL